MCISKCDPLYRLGLNEFMALLEERLGQKDPHPVGLVAKKVRKIGSPSKSLPPINAPVWAVDPHFGTGEYMYMYSCRFSLTHALTSLF